MCGKKFASFWALTVLFCCTLLGTAHALLPVITDFSAAALSTTSIQWSWSTGTFTGTGISGYHIYTSSAAGYKALGASTTFYIDSGLSPNRGFTRWITAYSSTEESAHSDHVSRYTYALPPASFVVGTTITATTAYLSWQFSEATAYAIECSTDNCATFLYNRASFVPWQTIQLLSNSTYYVRMGAINGDAVQTPGVYSATATFVTPPFTPPLYGVAVSSYTIEWRWSTDTCKNTGVVGYRIYKSTITGDTVLPAINDIGIAVYEVFDVARSSWVEIFGEGGNSMHTRWIKSVGIIESTQSVKQKYTYAVAPGTCAAKIPDFANVETTSIMMDWDTTPAAKYVIEYSTRADFTLHSATSIVTSHPSNVTDLTPNTRYDIRIGAINGDEEQTPANAANPYAYSQTYRVATRMPVPDNITASAVSDTAIRWSWSTGTYTDITNMPGYRIGKLEYFEQFSAYFVVTVANIPGKETSSYDLNYLMTNSTHTRYISADQEYAGYRCFGSKAAPETGCTFATPPNDINFSTITSRSINIWWKHPETPATQYQLERSTTIGENGPWVFISSVTDNTYNDTGLQSYTTYSYRVGAINQLGILTDGLSEYTSGFRRDYSFVSSTMTLQDPPALYALALGTSSIIWSWTSTVSGVTAYEIYSSTSGLLRSLSASTTFWIETGLSGANSAFSRKIRAQNDRGWTAYSDPSVCYTWANPPYALAIATASLHSITIAWNGNGGSYYRISRSPDRQTWTTLVDNTAVYISTSYRDSSLRLATTYYYAVTGYNGDGIPTVSSATYNGGISMTASLPPSITLLLSTATATQTQQATLDAGSLTISFPAGTLSVDGYLNVNTDADSNPVEYPQSDLDSATSRIYPSRVVTGSTVEIFLYDLYGTTQTYTFDVPITLTFSYNDINGDDIIDGSSPQLSANTLKIFAFDPADKAWEIETTSVLNKTAKTASARISHFSIYSLVSYLPVKSALADAFVYPNPYKPGTGGSFDRTVFGDGVVFESLTARAKIRVFNVAGELVADLAEEDGDGRLVWNATNSDGSRLASGLYIYMIQNSDDSSDKRSGKLAIIK
ncbi:MAG: hypothetical protein A2219_03670 [Elusimicrobia bacterium RIFOXYA2_FULL_50_26]|nr:MAG: hypothetical protein A2219_03670 [Elusimicrobia bacterium RIFOXYA2_FULL_50_26]OGS22440.1 MAG: hypothetical protein A2314_07735 [Elusimicrobia bacterium RIFOXYB2_FULL_50_12]